MKKDGFVKLLRKIIRDEVSKAVKNALNESKINQVTSADFSLTEMSEDSVTNKPRVKKQYTKNSMLNDLLNETAATPVSQEMADWSSMNYKSEMAEAFGQGMSASKPVTPLATKGINGEPVNMNNENVAKVGNAMTKDYSALMKAIDKKNSK